ncbi:MAG: hypothetical protein C0478_17685 [Planctomyces sp.]|nr:hypothetical protein [Planctomyces sp.]
MTHDLYRNLLLNNPLGQDLYSDYKSRINNGNNAAYSFSDVVYFVLIAASSGIIGNFAYDAVKKSIKKLAMNNDPAEIEAIYEKVVRETKYEELRVQYHPDGSCIIESTSQLQMEIQTRYRLVTWKHPDCNHK